MKQGTLDVAVAGMPAALDVYDDGLVFVSGSKGASVGLAFGAIGALIGGAAAKRGLAKRRTQIDALGATSASAGAVEGCDVIPAGDIRSVQVKKGLLGPGRRLIIDRATGRKLNLVYSSKKQPTSQVETLLRPIVGDKLEIASGA